MYRQRVRHQYDPDSWRQYEDENRHAEDMAALETHRNQSYRPKAKKAPKEPPSRPIERNQREVGAQPGRLDDVHHHIHHQGQYKKEEHVQLPTFARSQKPRMPLGVTDDHISRKERPRKERYKPRQHQTSELPQDPWDERSWWVDDEAASEKQGGKPIPVSGKQKTVKRSKSSVRKSRSRSDPSGFGQMHDHIGLGIFRGSPEEPRSMSHFTDQEDAIEQPTKEMVLAARPRLNRTYASAAGVDLPLESHRPYLVVSPPSSEQNLDFSSARSSFLATAQHDHDVDTDNPGFIPEIKLLEARPSSKPTSILTASTKFTSPLSISMAKRLSGGSYQYQPLKEMEFRLVKLLPEKMSTLRCEILHYALPQAPDYFAVSYAWGDGVETKSLIVEGETVQVSANLHDALHAVRQKKEEIMLWVDALCIDQSNKAERADQVRLMGYIYSHAIHVAIWLGPEADHSDLAMMLLEKVANGQVTPQRVRAHTKHADSAALLAVFKRGYWQRLFVVQEVLLARKKIVYCGSSIIAWKVYKVAAEAFWGRNSDPHVRLGPSSFPARALLKNPGEERFLDLMRACRRRLCEDPRDKVFGLLGMLPETQEEFRVDYDQSIKTVYTDVVDYVVSTSDQLDVIRESIHFPLHVNVLGLPSWCPDWSRIPEVTGLGENLAFAASTGVRGPTKARYHFHDGRRKLEISAIKIDVIKLTGVAVGTSRTSQDYLTSFLNWRATFLHGFRIKKGLLHHPLHDMFCRTLCMGQIPEEYAEADEWNDITYHVFSTLIQKKLPRLLMDKDLKQYIKISGLIEPEARKKFLQEHFGNRMMGRSFCITKTGLCGMGSGSMMVNDIIVVPLGCSTPIILRPEGRNGEFIYVGDVYVDGYMHGEAVDELEDERSDREIAKYLLR